MKLAAGVASGIALLLLGAAPAAADPPEPTDYRSRVERVEPAVDGVEAKVVGGDSFVEVEAERGHEVVVEDYRGDPYLRILADGTVQENQRSEATYINADRYGATVPSDIELGSEPEWLTIDDDGQHAWHDHRIHWMSPEPPRNVERGSVVPNYDPWTIPITVDGEAATIEGTLVYEDSVSPVPYVALGALAAIGLAVAGGRRRDVLPLPLAAGAALVGALLALVAGRAEFTSSPGGVGVSPATWLVPAAGLVAGLVAVLAALSRRRATSAVAALAAAACLAGWAVLRLSVLWKPVLPTSLSGRADRASTVLALGLAVAVPFLAIRSGALDAAIAVDDDEEDEEDDD